MRDIDAMIDEALGEEESALLRRATVEPNWVLRLMGLLGPEMSWAITVMMVVQTALFFAALWAAWQFFEATDPVAQLRWGLPAAVLFLTALQIKLAVGPAVHHNRLMSELKRIELQIARTRP